MKRYIILWSIILLPCLSNAQKYGESRLDSLLGELPAMQEDTTGMRLLSNIATAYYDVDPAKSLQYARRELALARKIDWKQGEAWGNNDIGLGYLSQSDYPAALEFFFKALKINEILGDRKEIGFVTTNIGYVYHYQGNYEKALESFFKALKIFEDTGNKDLVQNQLSNIALVYHSEKKYDEALAYNKRSLKLAEEMNEREAVATNIGNIADLYALKKNYPEALAFAHKALRMSKEMEIKSYIAVNTSTIGEIHFYIASDSSAIKPDSLIPAGRTANLLKGIEFMSRGLALSREVGNNEYILYTTPILSRAYALQGNFKAALSEYQKYISLKDSLFGISNNERIARLETQRAFGLKEKEIEIGKLALAKKRNERVYFISGIILLLGIVLSVFRSKNTLGKEKKKSDDLLLNILPSEVAIELKERGASTARQFEAVTVLFTDFVDFTIAGERMEPKELVEELHSCFKAFDEIISSYNIEKIKTIGDAYLAVSGLPVPEEAHAVKIVEAALGIRQFMHNRKQTLGDKTFDVRIGVHSGPVVAGIVGVKKFAYDIWGDTVNTAARMEQNSDSGKINISETTYALVRDRYVCTYRGEISAKNKGNLKMYFVEHAKTAEMADA